MSLLRVYPGVATDKSAKFRVIALGDDPLPQLRHEGQQVEPTWQHLALDNKVTVHAGTAEIAGLPADTECIVGAFEGGQEMQRAIARTLPAQLGTVGAELRILLASCYCRLNNASRGARDLFGDMFRAYGTPHLKIWCGDQVYLDSPAAQFLFKWNHTPAQIADNHLTHYVRTWGSDHLGEPLSRGANAFAPDDHEYWNNAPYPNAVVPGLYDRKRRHKWREIAAVLLEAFQKVPPAQIDVPPVSILLLDTRSARTPKGKRREFMTQVDRNRLEQWVKSLARSGPGLLVLGQPLFASGGAKALVPSLLEDYSLADFEQFVDVLRILGDAPRDLVVLTGDVHFTRAARAVLPSERQIFEIVNSPLALVVGLGRSKVKDAAAFDKFPAAGPISSVRVDTDAKFRSNADSAIALSIHRHGLRVRVKVELWCVADSPGASSSKVPAYEFDLL